MCASHSDPERVLIILFFFNFVGCTVHGFSCVVQLCKPIKGVLIPTMWISTIHIFRFLLHNASLFYNLCVKYKWPPKNILECWLLSCYTLTFSSSSAGVCHCFLWVILCLWARSPWHPSTFWIVVFLKSAAVEGFLFTLNSLCSSTVIPGVKCDTSFWGQPM